MSSAPPPDPVVTWQRLVNDGATGRIWRAAVPGGWLVRVDDVLPNDTEFRDGDASYALSVTFLPDPEHQWDGWSVELDGGQ